MNLNNYLNDIEKVYIKSREKYLPQAERLERLESSHKNMISSGELSPKGLERENARYNESKKEYVNILKEIREEFLKECGQIKGIVSDVFRDNYEVNPKYIDHDTMTILNSGILTESELIKMCDKYNSEKNITMLRLVGSYISDPKTTEGKKYKGIATTERQRDDLKIIDQVATLYTKGLQDDLNRSNKYNNSFDEILADIRPKAEKIESIKSPLLMDE